MATLIEILSVKWPGIGATTTGDDYATLRWEGEGPPPSEAEIRAFSGEVDAILAARAAKTAAETALMQVDPAPFLLLVQMSVASFTAIYECVDAETKARLDAHAGWQAAIAARDHALGQ